MSTDLRLQRYALAATTAPIAVMSMSASAEIIYESIDVTIGGIGSVAEEFDVNIGGYGSARFYAGQNIAGPTYLAAVRAPGGNKSDSPIEFFVTGKTSKKDPVIDARRFAEGQLIDGGNRDQSVNFASFNPFGADVFPNGEFAFGGNGYVGFTIDAGDGLRYGWVELSWNAIFKLLTIEGFAYETQVGASINAGEGIPAPGALGLFGLAAGAAGIRRKRKL